MKNNIDIKCSRKARLALKLLNVLIFANLTLRKNIACKKLKKRKRKRSFSIYPECVFKIQKLEETSLL
jgi:hypothetical protein